MLLARSQQRRLAAMVVSGSGDEGGGDDNGDEGDEGDDGSRGFQWHITRQWGSLGSRHEDDESSGM